MSQQKPLDQDEKIAVMVAFSVIGAILLWNFTRPEQNFQQSLFSQETQAETATTKEVPREPLKDGSSLVDNESRKTVIVEKKETISPDYYTTTKTQEQRNSNDVPPVVNPIPQPQPTPIPQTNPTDQQSNLEGQKPMVETQENMTQTITEEIKPETPVNEVEQPTTPEKTPDNAESKVEQKNPVAETEGNMTETTTEETKPETPQLAKTITPNFIDVPETYWAYPFIQALQKDAILKMTEDQKYNPDGTITRAEYGQLLGIAFDDQPEERQAIEFKDTPTDSEQKIESAVKQKFLSGYPDDNFKPNQPISRVHVLLSLVNGLQLTSTGNQKEILANYEDQTEIPEYAKSAVAIATEKGLIVQQPNTKQLNPNESATRAEVAAMIYQALVIIQGKPPIDSEYLVKFPQNNN